MSWTVKKPLVATQIVLVGPLVMKEMTTVISLTGCAYMLRPCMAMTVLYYPTFYSVCGHQFIRKKYNCADGNRKLKFSLTKKAKKVSRFGACLYSQ